MRTSNTARNPNRKFYRCPRRDEEGGCKQGTDEILGATVVRGPRARALFCVRAGRLAPSQVEDKRINLIATVNPKTSADQPEAAAEPGGEAQGEGEANAAEPEVPTSVARTADQVQNAQEFAQIAYVGGGARGGARSPPTTTDDATDRVQHHEARRHHQYHRRRSLVQPRPPFLRPGEPPTLKPKPTHHTRYLESPYRAEMFNGCGKIQIPDVLSGDKAKTNYATLVARLAEVKSVKFSGKTGQGKNERGFWIEGSLDTIKNLCSGANSVEIKAQFMTDLELKEVAGVV